MKFSFDIIMIISYYHHMDKQQSNKMYSIYDTDELIGTHTSAEDMFNEHHSPEHMEFLSVYKHGRELSKEELTDLYNDVQWMLNDREQEEEEAHQEWTAYQAQVRNDYYSRVL